MVGVWMPSLRIEVEQFNLLVPPLYLIMRLLQRSFDDQAMGILWDGGGQS